MTKYFFAIGLLVGLNLNCAETKECKEKKPETSDLRKECGDGDLAQAPGILTERDLIRMNSNLNMANMNNDKAGGPAFPELTRMCVCFITRLAQCCGIYNKES